VYLQLTGDSLAAWFGESVTTITVTNELSTPRAAAPPAVSRGRRADDAGAPTVRAVSADTTRDHRSAVHTDPVRTLAYARELAARDHGLSVVAVARPGGTVGASVVSAGVMPHPATGKEVVAFVSGAAAHRLDRLRHGQPITVTFRAGWQWATVEGAAELCGPDDPHPQIPAASLPRLLRDIFTAAGGVHDDWDAYDRVMAEERRVAVLITPRRAYTNPGGP
jgi:hypothetical protein